MSPDSPEAISHTVLRTQPSTHERLSRSLAVAALLSLILLCLAWELWLVPIGRGTLAIKALPLLPALPGLWRYRLYTYRWLSLLVWLYITEGAVRLSSDGGLSARLAGIEILLSLLIFAACAWHIRLRLAAAKPSSTSPAP